MYRPYEMTWSSQYAESHISLLNRIMFRLGSADDKLAVPSMQREGLDAPSRQFKRSRGREASRKGSAERYRRSIALFVSSAFSKGRPSARSRYRKSPARSPSRNRVPSISAAPSLRGSSSAAREAAFSSGAASFSSGRLTCRASTSSASFTTFVAVSRRISKRPFNWPFWTRRSTPSISPTRIATAG